MEKARNALVIRGISAGRMWEAGMRSGRFPGRMKKGTPSGGFDRHRQQELSRLQSRKAGGPAGCG